MYNGVAVAGLGGKKLRINTRLKGSCKTQNRDDIGTSQGAGKGRLGKGIYR